jgi:hypothetical protein
MYDFTMDFSGLSGIAKALKEGQRERTLADVGRQFASGSIDYDALGAKLMAAGDVRNALLALRIGAMRGPRYAHRIGAAMRRDDDAGRD